MTTAPASKRASTLEFLLTFLALFLVVNFGLKFLFPQQFGEKANDSPVTLRLVSSRLRMGISPSVVVENRTQKDLPLLQRCPQPPLDVALVRPKDGGEEKLDLMANQTVLPCMPPTLVPAGQSVTVDLNPWKYSLFDAPGTYEISLELPASFLEGTAIGTDRLSARLQIAEPGFLVKSFRTFITKPLFNALVFIASYLPDHNLGLAIILLTLLVKLLLLIPNQHALEGQRKLQLLQPRLDEIKRKYPEDPKRVQEETLRLWKELKINPLQSCLPTLLQFPILIGLFFVVQEGVALQTAQHLLYPVYQALEWKQFGHTFLGLDLLKPDRFILPPLLVVLQFVQMKMMFVKQRKQQVIDVPQKPAWLPTMDQQTLMLYGLPIMIGVFAYGFAAAVSLYWAASTLFSIAQQWYVMREKINV